MFANAGQKKETDNVRELNLMDICIEHSLTSFEGLDVLIALHWE